MSNNISNETTRQNLQKRVKKLQARYNFSKFCLIDSFFKFPSMGF